MLYTCFLCRSTWAGGLLRSVRTTPLKPWKKEVRLPSNKMQLLRFPCFSELVHSFTTRDLQRHELLGVLGVLANALV